MGFTLGDEHGVAGRQLVPGAVPRKQDGGAGGDEVEVGVPVPFTPRLLALWISGCSTNWFRATERRDSFRHNRFGASPSPWKGARHLVCMTDGVCGVSLISPFTHSLPALAPRSPEGRLRC